MKKEHERKEDGIARNSSNNCGWLDESSDDDVVVKIEVTNNRKE